MQDAWKSSSEVSQVSITVHTDESSECIVTLSLASECECWWWPPIGVRFGYEGVPSAPPFALAHNAHATSPNAALMETLKSLTPRLASRRALREARAETHALRCLASKFRKRNALLRLQCPASLNHCILILPTGTMAPQTARCRAVACHVDRSATELYSVDGCNRFVSDGLHGRAEI